MRFSTPTSRRGSGTTTTTWTSKTSWISCRKRFGWKNREIFHGIVDPTPRFPWIFGLFPSPGRFPWVSSPGLGFLFFVGFFLLGFSSFTGIFFFFLGGILLEFCALQGAGPRLGSCWDFSIPRFCWQIPAWNFLIFFQPAQRGREIKKEK